MCEPVSKSLELVGVLLLMSLIGMVSGLASLAGSYLSLSLHGGACRSSTYERSE